MKPSVAVTALAVAVLTGNSIVAGSFLQSSSAGDAVALVGARLIDGSAPREATIAISGGRVTAVGPAGNWLPAGHRAVDVTGKFVIPGLISAHAHVSDVQGLRPRAYTDENTRRQLGVYARYGITSVFSLGGEQAPAYSARAVQSTPGFDRARIFLAGDIVTSRTPEAARQAVADLAARKPDIVKIRVDDNLGTAAKMTPEVYRAVIEEAHKRGLRVAAHIFYLADAKDLVKAGVDLIAHSVRDVDVDDEFLAMMKAANVPYCPTLTREVATFGYESTPAFFADPFFQRDADRDLVAQLQEPARQVTMRASATAQRYKAALAIAKRNLKRVSDAGVIVAMGTDSGAFPERFQGFFEHLEMEMMVEAGMTPAQVLRSATVDAARAMKVDGIGALTPGAWADLVVLDRNPLTDIRNTRSISAVWVAGRPIAR